MMYAGYYDDVDEIFEACETLKSKLDYGMYLDSGDGVGLDDYEQYNYGLEDISNLEGILDIFGKVASVIGKAGSFAWKGIKTAGGFAVKAGSFVGKQIGKGAVNNWNTIKSVVTKIPSIAQKAYTWASTSRITAPVRWAWNGTKWVATQVWNGAKWLFQSNPPKAGAPTVVSPTQPTAPPQGAENIPAGYYPQGEGNYVAPPPPVQYVYEPSADTFPQQIIKTILSPETQAYQPVVDYNYNPQVTPPPNIPQVSYGTGGGSSYNPPPPSVIPEMPQPEEAGAVPSWLVPAGIGVALMLILTMSGKKGVPAIA